MVPDARVIAAVDVGTNTAKLTVARVEAGVVTDLDHANDVLRLGKALGVDGELAAEAVERLLTTLHRFERQARSLGAMEFIGVATQALRLASNREAIEHRIAAETPWQIDVITGDEEAELTFEGLKPYLPSSGEAMIVDIGGGSTEFVFASDAEFRGAISLSIGSGLLTDLFVTHDPPHENELRLARARAAVVIRDVPGEWSPKVETMLLPGGAGQFLEALLRVNGTALDPDTIATLGAELSARPAAEVAATIGIPEERARVLPAGLQIALAARDRFRPAFLRAVPSGIRIGLLHRLATS